MGCPLSTGISRWYSQTVPVTHPVLRVQLHIEPLTATVKGDKLHARRLSGLVAGLLTWSTELTHGGSSGLVVDTAESTTFRHTPGCRAGPAVSLLRGVVDLHVGRALRQVFAVMAQTVLGNLDGVEVALRAPLGGERHAWVKRRESGKLKDVKINKQTGNIDIAKTLRFNFLVVTSGVLKMVLNRVVIIYFYNSLQGIKQMFLLTWQLTKPWLHQ